MNPPVDTSTFQLGPAENGDSAEEAQLLEDLAAKARAFICSRPWAPPIENMLLAYGVGGIIGLFLVRFSSALEGELEGETELWIVVGDLPSICFDSESAPTPTLALQLYCAIAQDWADAILQRRDLSESYPIPVSPTREHAEMLLSRVEFVRTRLIPDI